MIFSTADLAAAFRQKASVLFVVLQVAVAMAVVANATFIIIQHVLMMERDSGVRGNDVFSVTQQWLDAPANGADSTQALAAREIGDIQAIRDVPSVENAAVLNTLPLTQNLWTTYVGTEASTHAHGVLVSLYSGDESARAVLGLKLLSGRDFRQEDILSRGDGDSATPSVVIVSAHLAQRLFGSANALGRVIYLNKGAEPSRIVGVVENLQSPAIYNLSDGSIWDTVLLPVRKVAAFTRYVVRARSGRIDNAVEQVKAALYRKDPNRLLTEGSIYRFSDIKADAYQFDRALTYTMIAVSLIMIFIAGGGIFAITSLWTARRTRSLGIRRALGARRLDIIAFVLTENFILVALGCTVGIGLAMGMNVLLMKWYEASRISGSVVACSVVTVLLLGQLAALKPALRSGRIDPGTVIRVV